MLNGAKIRLPVDVARNVCARIPQCKIVGAQPHNIPTEKVSWPAGKTFEIVGAPQVEAKPIATQVAKPMSTAPGRAANKDMAKAKVEEK